MYRKLAKYLESKDYDVKVFNLVNPTYSNGARFIKFIEDETDAQIFSQIVIEGMLFLPKDPSSSERSSSPSMLTKPPEWYQS